MSDSDKDIVDLTEEGILQLSSSSEDVEHPMIQRGTTAATSQSKPEDWLTQYLQFLNQNKSGEEPAAVHHPSTSKITVLENIRIIPPIQPTQPLQ